MKRFMFRFQGLRPGWVGPAQTFTITVSALDKQAAALKLTQAYTITKTLYNRQLKAVS